MELGKLESNEFRDHVNSSQTAIKDTSPILHGVQLAHHTDEELRNVEYRPGLTLEEYQALQNKKGSHAGHAHSSQTSHSTHSASPGIKNPQAEKSQNKRKFKILVNNYRLILRFLVFSYQLTHGLYLVMYIAPFFSNPFVKWMIQVTSISAVGTVIYNYIQTAQITSLSFKRKKSKSFLSNAEYKECDKCDNIWKPSRTHHCSVQAHDVLRMDHYCPVTLNTIGMRNHGAFFMTGVYHLICCLMWMILYFVYACYQFKPLIRSGILRAMLYILFGLTDYLIIASLAGLSVGIVASHIAFILNNRTTLEGYGETQALVTDLRKVGSYNLNILYNLRQFYSVWFGLLPFQGAYDANKYEGYFFHKVGEPREHFTMNHDSNNGHMFGRTKLDLADDQIVFVANKLYETNTIVVNASDVVVYEADGRDAAGAGRLSDGSAVTEEREEAAI